ncbi:hypothetical protein [Paramagnetospirillum caucaseum]|uniref:hypothetical protein n=1 Tax=Paramagnetospirillum caucaseum TaxID=1244869 RepID=UPI001267D652|nr:hypothetical protein [Paramagnetospirillum caucaseum]
MPIFDPSNPIIRLALRITWSEQGRHYTAATVAEAFGLTSPVGLYNTLCKGFERGAGPVDEGQLRTAYGKDVRRHVSNQEWEQSIYAGREAAYHLAAHLEILEAQRREQRRARLSAAGSWCRRPQPPKESPHV